MSKSRILVCIFSLISCFSFQLKAQKGELPIQSVNTVPLLFAALKNNASDSACYIICYNLLVIPKKGDPYAIQSMGVGQGVGDLKTKLAILQAGDVMNFTNVMVQCPNEKGAKTLENRTFILK